MKRKILIQLDTDPQPSVFDAVVAVDSGVDFLFRQHGVSTDNVRDLVYGAMFTRGPEDLHSTAIFIGGSNVAAGEAVQRQVAKTFFGPMRVSVLMDSNGANTTAAAAVLAMLKHVAAAQATVAVLGATGPVGQRVTRLLSREGAAVRVGSRSLERASAVCQEVIAKIPEAKLTPHATEGPADLAAALDGANVVIAAGAAGKQLVSSEVRAACKQLNVAIDLNAVPPLGIEGIDVRDKAVTRDGVLCYGAIGVGGAKMKIHKAAVARLFESNDQMLDAEEIFEIGRALA